MNFRCEGQKEIFLVHMVSEPILELLEGKGWVGRLAAVVANPSGQASIFFFFLPTHGYLEGWKEKLPGTRQHEAEGKGEVEDGVATDPLIVLLDPARREGVPNFAATAPLLLFPL